MTYTKTELTEYRELVEGVKSDRFLYRVASQSQLPVFVKRVGEKKCNEMKRVLKAPDNQTNEK